ncbi:MAG: glycosyltransferase family 4 protein [Bacteroidia bacterium]|nr:glycosyltransferase family 4 protein [Bacteroidia bacterium]MDW8302456.1 glycosyltransferase family 4 protein [Bacteroidia bacterium]
MHILYLHQYFCPPEGSGNNRSYEFAKEWAKTHTVTILTTKAYFPKDYFNSHRFIEHVCHLQIDNINVEVLNIDYAHTMNYAQRIHAFMQYVILSIRYLKRHHNFDVIYASSTPLSVGWIAYQAYKRYKIPYFFEVVDLWPDVPIEMGIIRNPFFKKWLWKWEKKIYTYADGIITLSSGMTKKILAKKIPESKIFTVPNGTNTNFFKPCPIEKKQGYKSALGFNSTDFIAIYSGTVGRANGVKYLIEIANLAQKDNLKAVKFVIVGSGNRIKEVKTLVQKYELNNIYFFDAVPKTQILPYLYAADVGIITFEKYPILNTNSANKFFDYLAVGLPICANYQGWQAEVAHNKAGLFAPSDDISTFYQNFKKLFFDSSMRSEFARNAVELSRMYDRKHLSAQVLSLLERQYNAKKEQQVSSAL